MTHLAAPALPHPRRLSGPTATLAITIPALAACLAVVIASPHEHLFDPLTGALAVCAFGASLASVSLSYPLLVDASFIPAVLAAGLGGPAEAFFIASVGELGSWALHRHRIVVVPTNILALGGPMVLAAGAIGRLPGDGLSYYGGFAVIAALAVASNGVVLTALIGVLDGSPVLERLREHLRLAPAIGVNVALAVAAAAVYREIGLAAVSLVLLVVLTFNYMANQVLTARQRLHKIEALDETRTRLAAYALAAEETARRALASELHDGPLQEFLVAKQELLRVGERQRMEPALAAIEGGIGQLRASVFELHPAVLEHAGLGPALEAFGRRLEESSSVAVQISVDEDLQVTAENSRLAFSLCRELMRNAAAHAHASVVVIAIRREEHQLHARVSDDGEGFDPATLPSSVQAGHIGLASVVERAEATGGGATITSKSNGGTAVSFWLPDQGRPARND